MSSKPPELQPNPGINAGHITFYVTDRIRAGTINLYSAYLLMHEALRFKRLSYDEMDAYIASREWRGKAGGYAIQGIAGAFVRKIVGSYTNVVGLPVHEVVQMLSGEGYPIHYNWLRLADGHEA